MTGKLAGKVAVVTGAGSGIGRAAATLFAREAAVVVIIDLVAQAANKTAAEITEAGGQAIAVGADISAPGQVENAFTQIHSIANTAGWMSSITTRA
jgi:NAD(P)-dependent dehydrogenase (short-subunit alcohol dehydrogenase family)